MKYRGMARTQAQAFYRQHRTELTWDNEMLTRFGADGILIREEIPSGTLMHEEEFAKTTVGWDKIQDTTLVWGQVTGAACLLMTQPSTYCRCPAPSAAAPTARATTPTPCA